MNKSTLERLNKNPHYKMSEKQRREYEQSYKKMVTFGVPPINNHVPKKHPKLKKEAEDGQPEQN